MSKHNSSLFSLFASLLGFAIISLSASAQTTAPNEWTWMGGSQSFSQLGVYGTLGVPAAGNIPAARDGGFTWTDSSGNLWLYGGSGNDGGRYQVLNDLWEFNPSTNEWTWMGGSKTVAAYGLAGVYGTLGTPASGNAPGSRQAGFNWTDTSGNLWLFGGWGNDANGTLGDLNDLWKFNPSTKEWAWMGGSSTAGKNNCIPGVYGTLGTFASGNIPGNQSFDLMWSDKSGNIWFFGGLSCANGTNSSLDTLWEFNPSINEWAWMGGSSTVGNNFGVYGTLGTPAAGNIPGGRSDAISWTDSNGNQWLFGGYGYDANGSYDYLNDFWELNVSTNEWAWMGGSNSIPGNGQPGVYGTLGAFDAGNMPGARTGASGWTDSSGNFWLFGGDGFDANGTNGYLNDLWEFNPSTNEWAWMGGGSAVLCYVCGQASVYGTLGTPAAGNFPGGRSDFAYWTDNAGNVWLFGGYGADPNGDGGLLNDFWNYQSVKSTTPAAYAPTFSVTAGTYTTAQTVSISDATPDTIIYYTTNGSAPTASSNEYTDAITISSTETLEAIATASGYVPSAVASSAYTINLPVPDFSFPSSPAPITVTAGQSGTTTVSITPLSGFTSVVSFACSGLPAGASCSFSPPTVTPPSTNSTTLTVSTSTTTAELHRNSNPLLPGSALAAILFWFGFRKRRRLQMFMLLAASVVGLGLFTGCTGGAPSSGYSSQPVTTMITVTATSGSLSNNTTFSLTVN